MKKDPVKKDSKKKNALSILFVCEHFHPRVAGGEVWSWELCKTLVKKGLRVTVLTSRPENLLGEETKAGVRILRRGKTGDGLLARWSWRQTFAAELRTLLKKESFDIVHSMAYATNIPATRLAQKQNIPCITSVHS
ncbi:glycosyltransferase family 4 protein, partial [Candidatus Woesearchaeota archaeon]|nr:glycosyltransferase family 4 protein [Candidatus Woesearchaeota archaeon]